MFLAGFLGPILFWIVDGNVCLKKYFFVDLGQKGMILKLSFLKN
jgi:hypothetical protein